MRLQVKRHRLLIEPQGPGDEAYIEEVLGLREDGQAVRAVRRDAHGLRSLAYLEIKDSDITEAKLRVAEDEVRWLEGRLTVVRTMLRNLRLEVLESDREGAALRNQLYEHVKLILYSTYATQPEAP